MSTTRSFGVREGAAGVRVVERVPGAPIQTGPFGSTVMVGVTRSGPPNVLTTLTGGRGHFDRVYGGVTQDSDAPIAAGHFYEVGAGAGTLHFVRVTDGTEVKATVTLYNRDVERGIRERFPTAKLPAAAFQFDAHNGGRWGGRASIRNGDVNLSTALTTSTVDLGFATLEDKWVGAMISYPEDATGEEYKVTGNTSAGVFTVEGEWSSDVINGTDGRYTLELENEHEITEGLEALAIELQDSGENPSLKFNVNVYRDNGGIKSWDDVALDPSGDAYWLTAITSDLDNYEIAPVDNFTGSPSDALARPANFAEIPAPGGVALNSLTFQIARWLRTGTGTFYLDTVNGLTWGDDPREVTIVLTFNAATTYTVAATFADGQVVTGLPSGTVDVAYPSQHATIPGWTISAGPVAAVSGDTLTLYARPLPEDLAKLGGRLYPAAAPSEGDTRASYRVISNDHESVTLSPSVDLTGVVTAPGAPEYTGAAAGPFDMSAGALTIIYSVGDSGPFTLTSSLSGAAETDVNVAADFNTQELARVSAVAADKLVEITATSDQKIKITALQDFGAVAILNIGGGTFNTEGGFVSGDNAGASPTVSRLQWRQELGGGYDGLAGLADSDYETAWDLDTSPVSELLEENTGVLRLATPGVTAAAVQTAMMRYAHHVNAVAYCEIPDTVTEEGAAVAWHEANLAIGNEQSYHAVHWPSYGEIENPYGRGTYTAPLVGAILGATSRQANDEGGYHIAGAGVGVSIGAVVKSLPTGNRRLNNKTLNSYGLIEMRKRGARFYIWGGRIVGPSGRQWLHKRLTLSHIGRVLLTNTDQLVWSPINTRTFDRVKADLFNLFLPWWRKGWFKAPEGAAGFTDSVLIKVDSANNTAASQALGELNSDIAFEVVDTAESVIFSYGPRGVAENS